MTERLVDNAEVALQEAIPNSYVTSFRFLSPLNGIYNLSCWQGNDGLLLLGRELSQSNPEGEPDYSNLVLIKMTPAGKVFDKKKVNLSYEGIVQFEDPRSVVDTN